MYPNLISWIRVFCTSFNSARCLELPRIFFHFLLYGNSNNSLGEISGEVGGWVVTGGELCGVAFQILQDG